MFKHISGFDEEWGKGLCKYVCGCKQVIGQNICPIHQKGITGEIVKKKHPAHNQPLHRNPEGVSCGKKLATKI